MTLSVKDLFQRAVSTEFLEKRKEPQAHTSSGHLRKKFGTAGIPLSDSYAGTNAEWNSARDRALITDDAPSAAS
jgi:hypothetical protein